MRISKRLNCILKNLHIFLILAYTFKSLVISSVMHKEKLINTSCFRGYTILISQAKRTIKLVLFYPQIINQIGAKDKSLRAKY